MGTNIKYHTYYTIIQSDRKIMAMSSRRRFGQRPPPVSRLIKTILDRYPDGQIFKVKLLLLW